MTFACSWAASASQCSRSAARSRSSSAARLPPQPESVVGGRQTFSDAVQTRKSILNNGCATGSASDTVLALSNAQCHCFSRLQLHQNGVGCGGWENGHGAAEAAEGAQAQAAAEVDAVEDAELAAWSRNPIHAIA